MTTQTDLVDWRTLVNEAEGDDVQTAPQPAYEFSVKTFHQRPADDYPAAE